MGLLAEVHRHASVLYIAPPEAIAKARNDLSRDCQDKPVVWFGLVYPYKKVVQRFEAEHIKYDNMFYIDCVSAAAVGEDIARTDHVLFVRDPQDLTGMAMAVDAFLSELPQERYVFMSALQVLHYYNSEAAVVHFIQFLVERAKSAGVHLVVMAADREDERLLRRCKGLFEKVVQEEKNG